MCGIAAFIGSQNCFKYIIYALQMLQNRGYDSAGICGYDSQNKNFILRKYITTKNISAVKKLESKNKVFNNCNIGIAHSRWASCGAVTKANSHPHFDQYNSFVIVHNGIIENYDILKKELINKNIKFRSETDSEVIAQLISFYYEKYGKKNVKKAIEETLIRLEGTWALVILSLDTPNIVYCARHGSPLLIGFSKEYMMVASEQSGFCKYIDNYVCLNNNDLIALEINGGSITMENMKRYKLRDITIEDIESAPDPYPHWTIKEIIDQYNSSLRALGMGGRIVNNRIKLGGLEPFEKYLKQLDHLIILGCGTSYNAGLYSLNIFKKISNFCTVSIFDGAEFTESDIPKLGKTGTILISQSGETKDLYGCIDLAKKNSMFMIGVVNVVDSLIAREVNCGVYLNAGREVGVAATKSFTSQVIVLHLIAMYFAQIRNINYQLDNIIDAMKKLPFDIKNTINNIRTKKYDLQIAKYLFDYNHCFILGKGPAQAIAKEGALKIKELCYIHAQGYSSSSLRHGTFALIEEGTPVIYIIPNDDNYQKNINTAAEVKSRLGYNIGISNLELSSTNFDMVIQIEKNSLFSDLLTVLSLQLIAYELAILKGNDVDKPKNLSKTITID